MTDIAVTYRASFNTARQPTRAAREEPRSQKPDPAPEPDDPNVPCRAARLLALAHLVQRLLDRGELRSHAEAARRLGITEGRVTQVMNLLLLSPRVQEAVLLGELRVGERALRKVARVCSWRTQESLSTFHSTEATDPLSPKPQELPS